MEKKENFILKADKRTCILKRREEDEGADDRRYIYPAERVKYLEIPGDVTEKTLQADIRKGAVHLKEVQELLKKDREQKTKYIVVNCSKEEDGLLAVSYLEACYMSREREENPGDYEDAEGMKNQPKGGKLEEWMENPYQIPVVNLMEVVNFCNSNGQSSPFANRGLPFLYEQEEHVKDEAYWEELGEESVCLYYKYSRFNPSGGLIDMSLNNIELFSLCKRIYFVCEERTDSPFAEDGCYFDDMEDDMAGGLGNSPRMQLVLEYAAEDVSVVMSKDKREKYYSHVFREMAVQKGASFVKGFPANRVVKEILSFESENTAETIEKILNYALKDFGKKKKELTAEHFSFISKFGGMYLGTEKKKRKGKALERMSKELIGLEEVKKQVVEVVRFMKFNYLRKKEGLDHGTYHNVYMMLGAPGTAKTTMAKFMGEIMREEKLLKNDRFIYVNGAELKGRYVGHTAPKVKAVFEENDIIVIDEAYSLVEEKGEGDSFSREAIAQLIIELENHSTDKLIIFAGYGGPKVSKEDNRMKHFLDANPGIRSRITSTLYFPSYSAEEMIQIFAKIAGMQNYQLEDGYQKMLYDYFEKRVSDRHFGNGREARSLLENCALSMASRIFTTEKRKYTKKELQMITVEDVRYAIAHAEEASRIQTGNSGRRMMGFQ